MRDKVIAGAAKQTGPGLIFLLMLAASGPACADSAAADGKPGNATWRDVDLSTDDTDGLRLSAQNLNDKTPSASSVGHHRDGIGASGAQARAPSIRAETGFDPVSGASEHMIIQFEGHVTRAELLLTYFYPDEVEMGGVSYHERGGWRAYMGAVQVDEGRFVSDANDGNYRFTVTTHTPFDRLEFFAAPYVSATGAEITPGSILTDSSDFLIRHIAYQEQPGSSPLPLTGPSKTLGTGNATGEKVTDLARRQTAGD